MIKTITGKDIMDDPRLMPCAEAIARSLEPLNMTGVMLLAVLLRAFELVAAEDILNIASTDSGDEALKNQVSVYMALLSVTSGVIENALTPERVRELISMRSSEQTFVAPGSTSIN